MLTRRGAQVKSRPCIARVAIGYRAGYRPAPGLAEKSIGQRFTEELAVMCDTFRPLRLTAQCAGLDDGRYALSWAQEPLAPEVSAGV